MTNILVKHSHAAKGQFTDSLFVSRSNPGPKVAMLLAKEFIVCPKAIRDIWTHKTWVDKTRPFWNLAGGLEFMEQPDLGGELPEFTAACARVAAALVPRD